MCPYCGDIQGKDEGCDHVQCKTCKKDYCFMCSAKRAPILEHGNHYHRKKCKHYSPYEENKFY